jgi:hypothetical protein
MHQQVCASPHTHRVAGQRFVVTVHKGANGADGELVGQGELALDAAHRAFVAHHAADDTGGTNVGGLLSGDGGGGGGGGSSAAVRAVGLSHLVSR